MSFEYTYWDNDRPEFEYGEVVEVDLSKFLVFEDIVVEGVVMGLYTDIVHGGCLKVLVDFGEPISNFYKKKIVEGEEDEKNPYHATIVSVTSILRRRSDIIDTGVVLPTTILK